MSINNRRTALHGRNNFHDKAKLYEKKRRRRKRGLQLFGIFILLLISTFFVVWKVFVVKEVEVIGNKFYSDEKMRDWILNDDYSDNSLYVYFKYRFFEPEDLPFVDTMEIKLKPPSTIQIEVFEKGILGYLFLEQLNQNIYFDKDGFVVETSHDVMEDVPKITGIEVEKIVLYERLPIKEVNVLKDLLALTQILKKYNVIPNEIDYNSSNEYLLEYDNMKVYLGTVKYLNDKILRLSSIMPEISEQSGVLHLESITEFSKDIVFEKEESKETDKN